jgi:hypothetical protein
MNEQFKKLADQASVTTITTKGMEFIIDGCYVVADSNLQKFAELIIKDCISLFDGNREMKTIGLLSHQQVIDQINTHFGVNE